MTVTSWTTGEPIPNSDPGTSIPAGDLADAVESGDLEIKLDDDQDEIGGGE